MWHSDYFLVASDFDAYHAAQGREVAAAYAVPGAMAEDGGAEHRALGLLFVRPHHPQLYEGHLERDAGAYSSPSARLWEEGRMADHDLDETTARAIAEGRHGDPLFGAGAAEGGAGLADHRLRAGGRAALGSGRQDYR